MPEYLLRDLDLGGRSEGGGVGAIHWSDAATSRSDLVRFLLGKGGGVGGGGGGGGGIGLPLGGTLLPLFSEGMCLIFTFGLKVTLFLGGIIIVR